MDDELRTPEYQNFVSIYRGFAIVGEKLERYTNQGLDRTYQTIYRKLAGQPVCTQQCSKIYKSQTLKWCASCNGWRSLLLKTRKNPNVLWEKTRSWEWPKTSENIAEIYLPVSWQNNKLDVKDIGTACYVWENCSAEFKIRTFILKKLREYRNKYFAHNASLKATNLEKAKVFDILRDLLRDKDVESHINVQECLSELTDIEQGYQIDRWMNEVQTLLQQYGLTLAEMEKSQKNTQDILQGQNELSKGQVNIQESQEDLSLRVKDLQINQSNIEKMQENVMDEFTTFKDTLNTIFKEQQNISLFYHQRRSTKKKKLKKLSWPILVLCICVYIYSIQTTKPPKKITQTACVSEQYSVPFSQDLPLLGYLYEHKSLTGRRWLMEHVSNELISPGSSQLNGIVLIAEMGYGKSALVSNLLCPGSNEIASFIQKHIVAFHICKFDVRSTQSIERFIRRLVGFFAMKSAEYGNIISMMPETSIIYDRDSCEKEPEACFDQGISIPIKQLMDVSHAPWIVVIDAIDECELSGRNLLLELLASRIHQLPKWLKFLLTSRNITSLTMLRKMKFEYLLPNDERNKEDIKQFIQESFPSSSDPQMVARLIDKSEGSFVYVIQALKWIADREDAEIFDDFPSELSDIYEINFDRQFKATFAYVLPKAILEITCSTMNPLSRTDILTVLRSRNVSLNTNDFDIAFNSLSFFLRVDENVRVSHQALYNWLISEQNMNYGISLKKGHALFSKYMFSTMDKNTTGTQSVVELAVHVAYSDDPTLMKMFVSSAALNSRFNESNYESLPHKLIWKTPSAKALKLLLHYYPDVDTINEGNVTPAFVAAAKGHVDQLILLHKKGARLNFTVKGNFLISSFLVFEKIEMMKSHYYSGYSLLHIAAHHGHISVMKYILSHYQTLVYMKNALGLHAGHVACESGHIDVIKYLYNIDSKLFEDECMFYASKKNHVNILKWLVQKGMRFNCVLDANSKEAAMNIGQMSPEKLTEYGHVYFPGDRLSQYDTYINPLDDWWNVFKIDPLNVAIRFGSLDAARYLIKTFPEALNCYDAFGYTPALLSIVYNRTDLLPLLTSNFVTDRCVKTPEHLQRVGKKGLSENNHRCPEGGSSAHLIALYSFDVEVFLYIVRNRLDIQWNEPDAFGNFPLHYAAANSNMFFLLFFEDGTLWNNINSTEGRDLYTKIVALNGSTAFHTAAISGQRISMYILTNQLLTPNQTLKTTMDVVLCITLC